MNHETYKPTDGELEILQVLWHEGEAAVRTVNERLNAAVTHEVGYTTTLKQMQIMHDKNVLTRRAEGKTHFYRAAVTQADTQGQLVDRLLEKAFGGSAMNLVMQALGNRTSSREERDEIRAFLDKLEK